MDLEVKRHSVPPFEVISVGGDIDVATAAQLRHALSEAVHDGRSRLIVDLDRVGFLDSTGLGVLVGALKRARAAEGSVDIVCTTERVLKVFEITGLDKVFGMFASLDEATRQTSS